MFILGSLALAYLICRVKLLFFMQGAVSAAGLCGSLWLCFRGRQIFLLRRAKSWSELSDVRQGRSAVSGRELLNALRLERLALHLSVSAEQMTLCSALFVPAALAAAQLTARWLKIRPQLMLGVSRTAAVQLDGQCIFSLRLGQIIYIAGKHFFREVKLWKIQ